MTIVSVTWVAWLFGFTTVYWILPRLWRDIFSVIVTATFVFIQSPISFLILAVLCIATYCVAQSHFISGKSVVGSVITVTGLYVLLQSGLITVPQPLLPETALPVGMAFYVLRCLHYVIESYKKKLEPHSFRQYCSYLFFLPTFVYGPVHRFPAFLRDSRRHRWDSALFANGLERILYGYVKVTVISHFLLTGIFLEKISALETTHGYLALYLSVWCKGVSFYFLLAGYADVAIGFALLLGYRVLEDYKWPFFCGNVSEFWGRWHISVSGWCREYVRGSINALTRRPVLGVLATMLVFALWHGISPHHFFWGIYNGLGLVIWQKYRELIGEKLPEPRNAMDRSIRRTVGTFITAHFLLIGFTTLKPEGRDEIFEMVAKVFG